MALISWLRPRSGDFSVADDWSSGAVPGPQDDVMIAARTSRNYSVTVGKNESVRSLSTAGNEHHRNMYLPNFIVSSATFTVGRLYNGGDISLYDGGKIVAGNILAGGYIYAVRGNGEIDANKIMNNGSIVVESGAALVIRAVIENDQGFGVVDILGGDLDVASPLKEQVTFSGGGKLELAASAAYDKTIIGFSTDGRSSLDLDDIGFVRSGEATFSGTASRGVLTVTDGTHTASIHLAGDYLAADFTASTDGHGGTIVVADYGGNAKPPHAMISAMAAFGAPPAHSNHVGAVWAPDEPFLAGPRVALA